MKPYQSLPIFLMLFAGCSMTEPANDLMVSETAGVKQVTARYIDEFGDNPKKDGLIVKSYKLTRSGVKVTTRSPEFIHEQTQNTKMYIQHPNDFLWVLDNLDIGVEKGIIKMGHYYPDWHNDQTLGLTYAPRFEAIRNGSGQITTLILQYPAIDGLEYVRASEEYHLEYNDFGLLSVSSFQNRMRKFFYDVQGRIVKFENYKNDKLTNFYTFHYDDGGLLASSTAHNGMGGKEYSLTYKFK